MPFRPASILSVLTASVALAIPAHAAQAPVAKEVEDPNAPVSFFKKVRPIFQAQCQGCHQPAKARGGYVMTDFARLLEGGDDSKKDGKKAIVPGKPAESYLIEQITPDHGEAEMPKKKAPLGEKDLALITRWVAEGAKDDTPPNARQRFDAEHLPIYTRPPVIASLDYSPDGRFLAITGFHEILLWKADGSALVARLVGLSERVQSVRFSPDGHRLAASAGRPAQMGEVQIWDVDKQKLLQSVPYGFDTVYGIDWSPDGKLVSFGSPDKSVRAVDSETGKMVLQQNAHEDWVLGTAFTVKGDKLVSVGRDMACKLTEVATQRFIDNLSSITPGALRGGLQTVTRHPTRDEFLVGGADGIPQAYRIERKVQRKIGDNALCIRKWPAMEGRIYSTDFAPDGKSFAAAASLDGKGQVNFYNYDFNTEMPKEFVAIEGKGFDERSAEEKKKLDEHYHSDTKLLGSIATEGGMYAVSYSPDGATLAAAGEDGKIRFISTKEMKVVKEWVPVTVSASAAR